MLLLEADGKRLLSEAGIAVPRGVRVRESQAVPALPGQGPWIAKAQVPVGGRGKAGGVRRVADGAGLPAVLDALFGLRIKGCRARDVLVEEACAGAEHYLALMVDASAGGIRLIHSPQGGVDIEAHAATGQGFNELLPLDEAALRGAVRRMSAQAAPALRAGLQEVGERLVAMFLAHRLMLAEINPLFAQEDGRFVAGDAKVVVDMNAVDAASPVRVILAEQRDLYPDAWRKLSEDFDFVEIDPAGRVGLVTTGAGLSMMLIDELVGQGIAPFNFCDMRTGQMRGSPERLLRIFDWLAAAPDVQVVLVNIFAGITDLSEFTQLLVDALQARPECRWPIVARLVGNGEEQARAIIARHPELPIVFEPDLQQAIARVGRLLGKASCTQEQGALHAV